MDFLENNDMTILISRCLVMIGCKHIKLEIETTSISAGVKVAKNILIPPDCVLCEGMQEVIWTNLKIINLSR